MITINKEEALILAASLETHKYNIAEMGKRKPDAHEIIHILDKLQERLFKSGQDERMIGRTSSTDIYSRIKRYLLKKNPKIEF
jgi:hypothetical protein